MKLALPMAACSLALSAGALAQFSGRVDDPIGADVCSQGRILRDRYRLGLPPVPPGAADEALGDTDVQHYNLEVEVLPSTSSIAGTNVMTVKSRVDNLTQFTFRLRNTFTITSALLNGSTAAVVNTASATTRTVTLDRPYNTGETFTLTIAYNGIPDSGGFGSFNFTTEGGFPFVDTLSEPYYAHTWWPCKDGDTGQPGDNSDKATFELAVIAPDTLTTVSNGLLVGTEPLSGGRLRTRWATNYQMAPYLLCFATGKFNTWSINYNYTQGTMPVLFYIWPSNDTANNRAGWERCTQMMDAFRPVFGLYPFVNEKYALYNFTFGGGMEHQTSTGQDGFSESLTAQELTHQWWGDNVTCRTWSDIWLNEGFATYGEAVWLERKPGSTGTPALLSAMASRRPTSYNGSVYRTNLGSVSSIFSNNFTYRKGAWVLHQLRHIVGDTTFFNILAQYRAQYEGSAATTNDFAQVASDVYGQDLTWFFQEWVFGTGAPSYQYGFQAVKIGGQNYARIHLRQSQTASYGMYTMPVDIRVNTPAGNQTITVWNNALLQHYLLPVAAAPTGIVIDEFNWILAQTKTSQTYVNGPPKVVQVSPAPGASVPVTPSLHATVVFSENVTVVPADFTLVGPGGPVAFTMTYTAATLTAALDTSGTLAPGEYTLTVNDSIKSVAAAIALDGELPGLPSGNGLAGGDAVVVFNVAAPTCYADCNGDGALNLSDFGCFQTKFALGDPYADCNGDGVRNLSDFGCFQTKFALGCP